MNKQKQGNVYIMGSESLVLYVGSTSDLEKRVYEHKNKLDPNSFTARYSVNKLLYYEAGGGLGAALDREKKIKGWKREKKLDLIRKKNPSFRDLAFDWYDD